MDYPELKSLTKKMYSKQYISKYYPEFYEYLNNTFPNINIKEQLYLFFNGLSEPKKCKVCGKYTKLDSFTKGYRIYCSSKCCNSDPDKIKLTKKNLVEKYGVENISQLDSIKEKKKHSCIEHYGVENPSQSQIIREKVIATNIGKFGVKHPCQSELVKKKLINTMLDRYGVEHPSQLDFIKEKKKQTYIEHYGVEHPSQLDFIKEKKKQTCIKHYGVEHPSQSILVKKKQQDKYNKNYMLDHPDIIEIFEEDGERLYRCSCSNECCNLCEKKEYVINHSLYHSRKYQGLEKCTICNPIDNKGKNTSIEQFVKNILDKYNLQYITNIRLFENLEVDIYIPSKQLAIECNGCYWHSDKIKLPKYHYNKYSVYKKHGIQLLTFWEDWIKNKPEIVESILLSKLGIYKSRIYARKCIIKEIDSKNCKDFLEKNHIQGSSNNSVRLCLTYMDNVVSVMTFTKKRRSMMGNKKISDNEWELTRFCNLKNTQVIGGADKLLKHFIQKYNPSSIVSFASHDISNGNLYKVLGFDKESEIYSSYWYIDSNTLLRYHRYTFRKSELIKKGYDKNLSEFQIMDQLKYYRIYDSGQSKYVLKLKKDLI